MEQVALPVLVDGSQQAEDEEEVEAEAEAEDGGGGWVVVGCNRCLVAVWEGMCWRGWLARSEVVAVAAGPCSGGCCWLFYAWRVGASPA